MKTRLGIVGPEDSVKIISKIAEEFADRAIFIPFIYQKIEDAERIIRDAEDAVDVWLFSGQAPYAMAQKYLRNKSSFFPKLNGSSLTKVLLDIAYKDRKELKKLSFDTIPTNEVLETFAELGLETKGLMINSYSGYKPTEELVAYHYELYNGGKVDSCITCIHSVYDQLKNMDIPVYRITPTKMVIRETVAKACQMSETIHFKNSQISVLIIQIYEMNKLIGENNASFTAHRLNLKLQELIIDFTEKISGSFVQQGNGKFLLFSTRGAIEQDIDEINTLLEKITIITGLTASIGIGYGSTALGAEKHAYLALNHAKNYGDNVTMLADESGVIEGPLKSPDSLSFSYRSDDLQILEKLKRSGVNITTYNKLLSIQNKIGQGSVSASDVARWLNMTQRHARRILSDLEKQDLAVIVGEEAPSTRGRPRKMYRVGPRLQ